MPCTHGCNPCLPPGTRVRLNRKARRTLRWNGSRAHVREFGRSEGVVLGHAEEGRWPEHDVRWEFSGRYSRKAQRHTSGLKYCYPAEWLEEVPWRK